jgi:Xaa-Pro aminopeptidase
MERISKLRETFADLHVDGILVTSDYNRRYITGFTGTAGIALITKNDAKLITDFRYVEQANKQAEHFDVIQHKGPIFEEVARLAADLHIKNLGFEQDHVVYSTFKIYEKLLENIKLVPFSQVIERQRMIKSDEEIKVLKDTAKIADDAFDHILSYIKPGVKEIEVSNELEFFMRKQGAVSSSFDIIVASGDRSALPHGVASEKTIEAGEFVTLDFGAYYKGYCSDITRTVAVGNPNDELRKIYEIVLEAQKRGMAGIKAGMTGKEADALTRDYIKEQGYDQYFGHSTGHGIGLEVHEGPALSFKSSTVLEPGMVVTVEPGIYVSGVGGVRIEDDTVVTKDGNQALTHAPKELIIL